jgi:hypothetical protein
VVGRSSFALERFASPRHRSHVAQLFSLGHEKYSTMSTTEREIRQDFNISYPLIWFFIGLVICLLVFAAFVSRDMEMSLYLLGAGVLLIILVFWCMRSSRPSWITARTWRLADAGLQRVYPSGETEVIRWEQIRHMKWARFLGLTIRWEESKGEHQHRSKIFRDEFGWNNRVVLHQYRATLFVQKEEAEALTSIAKNERIPVDWYGLW